MIFSIFFLNISLKFAVLHQVGFFIYILVFLYSKVLGNHILFFYLLASGKLNCIFNINFLNICERSMRNESKCCKRYSDFD